MNKTVFTTNENKQLDCQDHDVFCRIEQEAILDWDGNK